MSSAPSLSLKRPEDRPGDVVLDIKDVLELALVSLRPQGQAVGRVHQLGRHSEAWPRAADAALEDGRHSELLAHLARIGGLPLKRESRAAGRHTKAGDFAQRARELVGHPVSEVFLLGVVAHVYQGEHGDRLACRDGSGPASRAGRDESLSEDAAGRVPRPNSVPRVSTSATRATEAKSKPSV